MCGCKDPCDGSDMRSGVGGCECPSETSDDLISVKDACLLIARFGDTRAFASPLIQVGISYIQLFRTWAPPGLVHNLKATDTDEATAAGNMGLSEGWSSPTCRCFVVTYQARDAYVHLEHPIRMASMRHGTELNQARATP